MHQIKTTITAIFGMVLIGAWDVSAAPAQVCYEDFCLPITHFRQDQVMEKLVAVFKSADRILICQADESQKKCQDKPLTFSGQTNLMQVSFELPFIRILQKGRQDHSLEVMLDYQLRANEMSPVCAPTVSDFRLEQTGEVKLISPSFNCRATELGETSVAFQFQVDYINFETGWMGATYYATSFGDVVAKGKGYVMMQIAKEHSIQLDRVQPRFSAESQDEYDRYEHKQGELVDWDWDNIKVKWNSFKEKFLKILYLEPLE